MQIPGLGSMKELTALAGKCRPCDALKSFTNKFGNMLFHCGTGNTNKYKRLDAKLEKRIIEIRREASGHKSFKTIDSIIMKFPQLKEDLRILQGVFDKYECNGTIHREEFEKYCLKELLQVNLTEEETDDLFKSCDADNNNEIQFNEFVVLLCLIDLLTKPSCNADTSLSRWGSSQLEIAFNTIVEAFFYMDKNNDGKLNKKDMVMALTEAPWERSPAHVMMNRFMEMDRDKDGNVSFREFLFTFTSWLGIDVDDEIHITGD